MRAAPRSATAVLGVVLLLGAAGSARSAQGAGVTVPPVETVQGTRLQLVGCAARGMLWKELYALSATPPPSWASRCPSCCGWT